MPSLIHLVDHVSDLRAEEDAATRHQHSAERAVLEKLMGLMTKPVSPGSQKLASTSGSSADLPKLAATSVEPASWLAKSIGGE
jgi:hypothetical protein